MGSFPVCFDLINGNNNNEDMASHIISLCHFYKYDYTNFQAMYKLAELNGWSLTDIPSVKEYDENENLLDCNYLRDKYNCENLCPVCTVSGKSVNDNKSHEEIVISYFLNNKEEINARINKGLNEDIFVSTEIFEYKYTYCILKEIFKHLIEKKDIREAELPIYVQNMIGVYIDELEKINPSMEMFENSYEKLIEALPVKIINDEQELTLYKFNLDVNDEDEYNILDEVIVKNVEGEKKEKKRRVNTKLSSIIDKKINRPSKEEEHSAQLEIDEFMEHSTALEDETEEKNNKIFIEPNLLEAHDENKEDVLSEIQTNAEVIEEEEFIIEDQVTENIIEKELIYDIEKCNNESKDIEDNEPETDSNENEIEYIVADSQDSFKEYFYEILSSKDIYIEYIEETKEFIVYVDKLDKPLLIPLECTELLNSLSLILNEELKNKISFNSLPLIYELNKLGIKVNNIFDIKMAYALWKWPVNTERTIEDVVRSLIGYKVKSKERRDIFIEIIAKYGQLKSPFLTKHFDNKYMELYENESLFLQLIGKSYKLGKTEEHIPFKESDNLDIVYRFGEKDIRRLSLPKGKVCLQGKYEDLRRYVSELIKNNVNGKSMSINRTPAGYRYKINELYTISELINDSVKQVTKYSLIELLKRRDILNTSIGLFSLKDDSIILLIDELDKEPIFDALNQSMVVSAKELYPDYIPKVNISYL